MMKHRHFEVTTPDNHTIRIYGNPQMSEETLAALARMADLAYEHLSALELVDESTRGMCQECGGELTQPARGRRRKYCPNCVAQLRHRTPATQARKTSAEKSEAGL